MRRNNPEWAEQQPLAPDLSRLQLAIADAAVAFRKAKLADAIKRGDTRDIHYCSNRLRSAKHAQLREELGIKS